MTVHIYAGPTISHQDLRDRLPEAELHPPVAHGDLIALRPRRGDTVLIIDGDFCDQLPVRNQEIMLLLQQGVRVVGAAGMGALRAAELHDYGMVGVGAVFDMYRDGAVDADDEVAVSHGGRDEDYRPTAESLINIRCLLRSAVDAGVVSADESARLISVAQSLPLADRRWPVIAARSTGESGAGGTDPWPRLRDLVHPPAGESVQFQDALRALDFVSGPGADDRPRPAGSPVRVPVTPYVRAWLDQHRRRRVAGEWVDDVSVLRFLQLYDPAFPERWAGYTLGVIADGTPRTTPMTAEARRELDDRCVERARQRLGGAAVPESAQRYWLAAREFSLGDRERLLRVLVRSYRVPGGAPIYGCPQLFTQPAALWSKASELVAECWRENRRVVELSPRYSVRRLKREHVLGHFARIWRIENAPDAVLAAARDRAITSLDQLYTYGREMILPFRNWTADDAEHALR